MHLYTVVENLQVRQYLGSNWVFGSGKDAKVRTWSSWIDGPASWLG